MNNQFTTDVNNSNVGNIQRQILMKMGYNPFYPTIEQSGAVLTDFDNFPYTRWYRGAYNSSEPVVIEREAGYRTREDNCYKLNLPPTEQEYPNFCWEAPCSTVYRCYPETLRHYSDNKLLDVILNRACIPMYR